MLIKRMKGHLRLYRGGGDEGTLPEWLKGEDGTTGVYNNTLQERRPKSQISATFSLFVSSFLFFG